MIGKDISRFHAVFWPAFLMSASLPLPRQVVVHGFLFNRGEKMSKSVGNTVSPATLAEHYGVDALRYFFLREVPFGQDGSYSHEAIVGRINADLANDLGNLAQRSLSMIAKNCGGVPFRSTGRRRTLTGRSWPKPMLCSMARVLAMTDFALHDYLAQAWRVVGSANRYFTAEEPWIKRKTDPARMATILWVTAEVLREVALVVQPVMPTAMGRLLDLLGVAPEARDFAAFGPGHRLVPGTALPAPAVIFPALCRGRGCGRSLGLMLTDSHCHLDFPEFAPEIDAVVARATGGRRRPASSPSRPV